MFGDRSSVRAWRASWIRTKASTLRAYIARDEADIPLPQATEGNRKRWSRPVVEDWLEERRRDPSNVQTVLNGGEDKLAPGLSTL